MLRVPRGHLLERGFDLSGAASPRTVHDGSEHGDPSRPLGIKVRGWTCVKTLPNSRVLDFIREAADSFQYVPSDGACEGDFEISQSHRMKPVRAIVLSLAGGLVVLASGLAGVYIPKLAVLAPAVLIAVGLISGTLILVGASGLWMAPRRHMLWGLIVVLSSVPSLLIGGGLLGVLFPIGFMLSLVGGILAIQWKPRPMAPPTLRARRVAKTR